MDLKTCIQEGDLAGALERATAAVKASPTDASARSALFEVLCFKGDLDRAEKQLDVLAGTSMEMAYGASALKMILDGERRRRAVFEGKGEPDFLGEEKDWARPLLAALAGGTDADALEKLRATPHGKLNGSAFSDLRDGDDLLAPFLEVIVAGRYVWLAWGQIRSLTAQAPRLLRDLYCIQARISLATGQECEGFIPVLYPGSHAAPDDKVRLGLATEWEEEGGLVRGRGRRMLFADGEEVDILAVRDLTVEG